jgi:hypothetical protein
LCEWGDQLELSLKKIRVEKGSQGKTSKIPNYVRDLYLMGFFFQIICEYPTAAFLLFSQDKMIPYEFDMLCAAAAFLHHSAVSPPP